MTTRRRSEAKARIHLELAGIGSRIALYDLREMLSARPVRAAPTLLEAASRIGDATLVPALAADEAATADLCAAALASIVRREGLRRSSRVVKSVRREHQAALDRLWRRARRAR